MSSSPCLRSSGTISPRIGPAAYPRARSPPPRLLQRRNDPAVVLRRPGRPRPDHARLLSTLQGLAGVVPLNPVTAHTASRISDLPALVADRYFAAGALVIALRLAIDRSIGQDEPRTTTRERRHAASRTFLHEATNRPARTFLLSQRDVLTLA